MVYVAPDHRQDKGQAVPAKAKAPPQNLFNIYTQGKDAEALNQFVKQHTGFDVRLRPRLGMTWLLVTRLLTAVLVPVLQFEIYRSKTFLYVLAATFLALLVLAAKLVLDHIDFVLAKLRRKQLWMTVSLVRHCFDKGPWAED